TTSLTPDVPGSSQATYMRPNVGLVEELSIVIIGLSCWPVCSVSRPTVRGWKLPPGPMRLTKIRLGAEPLATDRPPNQTLPSVSAAEIGSPDTEPASAADLPRTSKLLDWVSCVQVLPPSDETLGPFWMLSMSL